MDTDSLYSGFTSDKLEDIIKPGLKSLYEEEKVYGFPEQTYQKIQHMTTGQQGYLKLNL